MQFFSWFEVSKHYYRGARRYLRNRSLRSPIAVSSRVGRSVGRAKVLSDRGEHAVCSPSSTTKARIREIAKLFGELRFEMRSLLAAVAHCPHNAALEFLLQVEQDEKLMSRRLRLRFIAESLGEIEELLLLALLGVPSRSAKAG